MYNLEGCPGTTCQAHMTLTFDLSERNFQMRTIVPNYFKIHIQIDDIVI